MIWFPIMANFAQPILRNIAQIWLFVKGEQILMKMKTQVDMINLNTKIFSFYDLHSEIQQPIWLQPIKERDWLSLEDSSSFKNEDLCD